MTIVRTYETAAIHCVFAVEYPVYLRHFRTESRFHQRNRAFPGDQDKCSFDSQTSKLKDDVSRDFVFTDVILLYSGSGSWCCHLDYRRLPRMY